MDPSTLATDAVALLAPYVVRAGNRAADDLGDGAVASVQRLYAAVRDRIKGTQAGGVLDHLSEDVESVHRRDALRSILAEAVEDDPQFLAALAQLVAEASADSTAREDLNRRYGNVFSATNISITGDVVGRDQVKKTRYGQ